MMDYDNEEKTLDIRLLRDSAGMLTLQQRVKRWGGLFPQNPWHDWIDVPVEESQQQENVT